MRCPKRKKKNQDVIKKNTGDLIYVESQVKYFQFVVEKWMGDIQVLWGQEQLNPWEQHVGKSWGKERAEDVV